MYKNFEKKIKKINHIKISDSYCLYEFQCKGGDCCLYSVKIFPIVIETLEKINKFLSQKLKKKVKLNVISGYRCEKWNKAIGGVSDSGHLFGIAVDIETLSIPLPEKDLAVIIRDNFPEVKRIGVYGKSFMRKGKIVPVRGYQNKVGFLHLEFEHKYRRGIKLPDYWGDW